MKKIVILLCALFALSSVFLFASCSEPEESESETMRTATCTVTWLNADGSEGNNTAAGTYGAWFDDDGNTTSFQSGYPYVYIESNELFSWTCGCHPNNSQSAYPCTVVMQFRHTPTAGAVNVKVSFEISNGGGGWW